MNNDGADRIGFAAPGVNGQAEVIAMAQAEANVDPETISYVEAHGTGTPLGDPIEIAALNQAFRKSTQAKGFLRNRQCQAQCGSFRHGGGRHGIDQDRLAAAARNNSTPHSLHCIKSKDRF